MTQQLPPGFADALKKFGEGVKADPDYSVAKLTAVTTPQERAELQAQGQKLATLIMTSMAGMMFAGEKKKREIELKIVMAVLPVMDKAVPILQRVPGDLQKHIDPAMRQNVAFLRAQGAHNLAHLCEQPPTPKTGGPNGGNKGAPPTP